MNLRGKVQKDIVIDLEVSSGTVSNWCTAKRIPKMELLNKLAAYLGVSKAELLESGHRSNYNISSKYKEKLAHALNQLEVIISNSTDDTLDNVIEMLEDVAYYTKIRRKSLQSKNKQTILKKIVGEEIVMVSYVANDYYWEEKEQAVLDLLITHIQKEMGEVSKHEITHKVFEYIEKPLSEIQQLIQPLNIPDRTLSSIINSIGLKYRCKE